MQDRRRNVRFEQRFEQTGDGWFADPAQGQGGQGNAELGGGNVGVPG